MCSYLLLCRLEAQARSIVVDNSLLAIKNHGQQFRKTTHQESELIIYKLQLF